MPRVYSQWHFCEGKFASPGLTEDLILYLYGVVNTTPGFFVTWERFKQMHFKKQKTKTHKQFMLCPGKHQLR